MHIAAHILAGWTIDSNARVVHVGGVEHFVKQLGFLLRIKVRKLGLKKGQHLAPRAGTGQVSDPLGIAELAGAAAAMRGIVGVAMIDSQRAIRLSSNDHPTEDPRLKVLAAMRIPRRIRRATVIGPAFEDDRL